MRRPLFGRHREEYTHLPPEDGDNQLLRESLALRGHAQHIVGRGHGVCARARESVAQLSRDSISRASPRGAALSDGRRHGMGIGNRKGSALVGVLRRCNKCVVCFVRPGEEDSSFQEPSLSPSLSLD